MILEDWGNGEYAIWCDGCGSYHLFSTLHPNSNNAKWSFDGDMQNPTFSPSLNVTWKNSEGAVLKKCHSFVEKGYIRYLSDSTHSLAGQTVRLPEVPDKLNKIKENHIKFRR